MVKVDREKLYQEFGVAPTTLKPPGPEPEEYRDWSDEELRELFPEKLQDRQKLRAEWTTYLDKAGRPVREAVTEEFSEVPPAVHASAGIKIAEVFQRNPQHYFTTDGSLNIERAKAMTLACYADACREQKVQLLDDYLAERRHLAQGKKPR